MSADPGHDAPIRERQQYMATLRQRLAEDDAHADERAVVRAVERETRPRWPSASETMPATTTSPQGELTDATV
jgi:hypothetical protein